MARLDYPNGPEDSEGILRYAKAVGDTNQAFWDQVEIQAWKNILFYLGLQRIKYSSSIKFWRPVALDRARLPVTNKVKTLVNDLASKLVAFKPPITWGPGSDQEADYVAAAVADKVNQVIEKEANIRDVKPVAGRWLATTGNVFLISTYDTSPENGTSTIQAQRCLHCLTPVMPADLEQTGGACPQCGSKEVTPGGFLQPAMEQIVPRFEPAVDGTGSVVGEAYPVGKHRIEVENVFTVRFDPYVERFHRSPYVRITRTQPESWVEEYYGHLGDEWLQTVAYSAGEDHHNRFLESIAVTAFGGSALHGETEDRRAVVHRLWLRPHPTKAPHGIYAEIVGEQVAKSGPYPYHDEAGKPMLNVAHLEFDQVPGRALAATRCDDVVELQEDLNEFDAFIKQHARRMANAIWLLPRGSNVSRLTGEEGLYVQYDPLATGHKPERAAGTPIGQDMLLIRNQKKAEMDEVFGLYEVARGEAPRGVTAYAALQLLDERAQQGQSNLFDNWALGWMEWSRQNINIAREYWDEQRTLALGFGRWAVQKFDRAQIQGGIDIAVDLGMNRPTTLIAKAARIGQAIQQGLVNVMDPQVRYLALRALGIPELMPDYNKDFIKAGRVLDQILSAMTPAELPPPPQPFDTHPIHLFVLRQFEIDEQFDQIEPWKQQAILMRAALHFQAMQMAMAQQGMRAGTNAPAGGGGHSEGGESEEKENYGTEKTVLNKETQGASPDTMTGAAATTAAATT